jgi:hypothetical protein
MWKGSFFSVSMSDDLTRELLRLSLAKSASESEIRALLDGGAQIEANGGVSVLYPVRQSAARPHAALLCEP